MLYKTVELEDKLLDAAVAKCLVEQYKKSDPLGRSFWWLEVKKFEPSTRWDHGGPIIEKDHITVSHAVSAWAAFTFRHRQHDKFGHPIRIEGPTPLIAAMRAYVASKFGDEVEIP